MGGCGHYLDGQKLPHPSQYGINPTRTASDVAVVLEAILSIFSSGMCVGRCTRFVGWSLVPISVLSMLSNTLLLFPNLKARYLLEGHVTPEATWSTGLWASGLLVLVAARSFISNNLQRSCCGFRIEMMWQIGTSSVAVAAAGICFLISSAGLACGPLCLHNSTEGLIWDQPLKKLIRRGSPYFPIQAWQTLTCEEPSGVVPWNAVLFSVLLATSGIQVLLCTAQTLNALLGMLCGRGFGRNKVSPELGEGSQASASTWNS